MDLIFKPELEIFTMIMFHAASFTMVTDQNFLVLERVVQRGCSFTLGFLHGSSEYINVLTMWTNYFVLSSSFTIKYTMENGTPFKYPLNSKNTDL